MTEGEDVPVPGPANQPREPARNRKGVIAFMARNGVAANLLMLFMLVAGLFAYGTIVQEVFSDSSFDTVSVSVAYPGATPEEVEESIVRKVEEAVQSVEGVKEINATASEGVGTVNVEMEGGTDMARALDDVKAEIDQISSFPGDAEEPSVRELTNRQTVIRIAIYGDVPEASLKETAAMLEEQLSALDEVSYVQVSSVRDYRLYIDVAQNRLEALGLSLNDVSRAISTASLDSPAGSLDTGSEEVRIRTVGQNYTQQDFEDVILVAKSDGTRLRLGDVATIEDGFEDNDLISRYNGAPVAFVDVYRTSDERVLDIANAVNAYLENDLELPRGVEWAIWQDDSELLADRLGLLLKNAAIGLILVLAALTLFLDIRLALWSAVGIGVTFVGAIFVLDLVGSSLNMFSLFGFILALGLVVDDAVVVGENIYAEREAGRSGVGAAIAGTQRVALPVIFAVATTIAAFLPLLAVEGAIGTILSDIPVVVLAVLVLSLIEALLVLPHHLSSLPDPEAESGQNRVRKFFLKVQNWVDVRFKRFVEGPLDRSLRFAVAMPYLVLAGGIALLIVFAAMVPAGIIKFQFFPEIEADAVQASLELPAGTPISRTRVVMARIEDAAERARERLTQENGGKDPITDVFSTVGASIAQAGPQGFSQTVRPNFGSFEYRLVTGSEREVSAGRFEELWREELGELPEARSFGITANLISFGDPVNVRLAHPDDTVLDAASERLMADLGEISGVFDIESDRDEGMQEIELRLKPAGRALGLTVAELASQVRAAFFGAEAVRVQRGDEEVRVYVRLPEDERDSIADIENYRVRVPGGQVPVGQVAKVDFGSAPSVIRREDGRKVATVTADVETEVTNGNQVSRALEEGIIADLHRDYPDLQIEFGGAQEEQAETFGGLGAAFGMALIVIYALLAIPFRSYIQPMIIMAAIPFGMIGALFGHLVLSIPLGILSMFGLVALSGVIINGSLVLIDFMNENLAKGMEPGEAVIDAAKSRFRPIMLTALTTFLGVAPITFETSLQAQFLIPMSTSLGFGVLFGTILLQLLIPALAILQMRWTVRVQRLFGKKDAQPGGHALESTA